MTINGKERALAVPCTVAEALAALGIPAGPIAVEVNGTIVPSTQFATQMLDAADTVEIIQFVGGG